MPSDQRPVALVTGGSAGLGLVIAQRLLAAGYQVIAVGRNQERLDAAAAALQSEGELIVHTADATDAKQMHGVIDRIESRFGHLNVLVNVVGSSDRGLIEDLRSERLKELMSQNVESALVCSQAALRLLEKSGGSIVNVGSLASKAGARYLGGYSIAKHALAGMTQQLRLEVQPRGIHVGLVSPGPIRRTDAGRRYQDRVDEKLPDQATAPGAGVRVGGLAPERVADAVLRCVRRRSPDIILPGYLRLLVVLGHAFPRLGDWLLRRLTSK